MRQINNIVLHCTASPQTQTVEAILNYWKLIKNWSVPGYHHMIKPSGEVANLLPIEKVSNGVAGHNHDSIHISYIGGVVTKDQRIAAGVLDRVGMPIDNRTPEQRASMLALVKKYSEMFPTAIICGHRDFSPDKNRDGIIEPSEWLKACPAFSVKDWLKEVKFKSPLPLIWSGFVTKANLNLREGAGEEFKSLGVLLKGTKVKKLAEKEGWYYVEVSAGHLLNVTGWVSSEYLSYLS